MRIKALFTALLILAAPAAIAQTADDRCEAIRAALPPIHETSITFAEGRHPDFTAEQVLNVARFYEGFGRHKVLAQSEGISDEQRAIEEATADIFAKLAAVFIHSTSLLPEMEGVLERMKAEEAAGLQRVSDELKPEVREVASSALAMSAMLADATVAATEVVEARFIAATNSNAIDDAERAVCQLEAASELLLDVAKLVPPMAALAYVENLYY